MSEDVAVATGSGVAHSGNGPFRSLRYPNFRLYIAGTLGSGLGTWMQRVAQDWLVLDLTGSASQLGVVVAIQFLSVMVFAPMAGVLIDRHPKRRLIVQANVMMGIAALALGLLDLSHVVTVWEVYALVFVVGAGSALDTPARQAFTGEMVRSQDLTNALGLGGAAIHSSRLVGPALAGLLIGWTGTPVVFLINAASYSAVIGSMFAMHESQLRPCLRPQGHNGSMTAAARVAVHRPDLMVLLVIIGGSGLFGFNLQLSITLMTTQVFHDDASVFGVLTSILAIGSVCGGVLAAQPQVARMRYVIGAGVAFGVVFVLTSLTPTIEVYAISLVALGMLCMLLMSWCGACFQIRVEGPMKGRLSALYYAVMMGSTGLGAIVLGLLGSAIGVRASLTLGGASAVLLSLGASATLYRRGSVARSAATVS